METQPHIPDQESKEWNGCDKLKELMCSYPHYPCCAQSQGTNEQSPLEGDVAPALGDDHSAPEHCYVCGTSHHPEDDCPISAFCWMECDCGNGFLMPWDATMMGAVNCGQCGSDKNWSTRQATEEDRNDN